MINLDLNIIAIFILITYFLVCLLKKISFKIAFIVGIIFLVVSAGFLMFEEEDLANDLAIISYYLLIVAVALVIVEYFGDTRKTKEEKKHILKERPNFCPYCGTKFEGDFKFCAGCGTRLFND